MGENALDDHALHALAGLGGFSHPEDLFDQGLELLVRQLQVDRANVASASAAGLENLWSAGPARAQDPNLGFCSLVMQPATGTLVIVDAAADPRWMQHSGWRELKVRAYMGAPLNHSGRTMGVLSVQCGATRQWRRSEVATLNVMAALFAKAMEVEALKVQLWRTQEALDLTSAVVEDNAMESPGSGLPSRRYLEVWCRSNLNQARRRGELIALVTWLQPPGPARARILERVAGSLRGIDLLVDLGRDRYLLVLPRTMQTGAEVVLERVRRILGPVPMGATLWNPMLVPDRDSQSLQLAIRRALAADPGGPDPQGRLAETGAVSWKILEANRESLPEAREEW